jgi:hypothetical protein
MKKVLLAGMVTMVALQMSVAHAAISRAVDVRNSVVEENKKALEKGALTGVNEASATAMKSNVSDLLVGVARNADNREMSEALSRTIRLNDAGKASDIKLLDIGRKVLMAKQSLDKINRNDLDDQGKAHFDQLRQALEVSSQFMTLASKSSDIGTNLNPQTQKEVDAFNRQLSLIPDLLKMDTRELKSHVDIMQAAVNAKTSARVTGDQAYAAALKAKYGAKYQEKLEEILGCAR